MFGPYILDIFVAETLVCQTLVIIISDIVKRFRVKTVVNGAQIFDDYSTEFL